MSRSRLPGMSALTLLRGVGFVFVVAVCGAARAAEPCPLPCGDFNGDGLVDVVDFSVFESCMGESPELEPACSCADMDGSGSIDLHDFALFAVLYQHSSDELPPDCTGAWGATANLTAFRPQHGSGYAPFARTAVAEADEENDTRGPGIRINAPGDVDPAGEDDLIEVTLSVDPPGAALALSRSDAALRVWTTRDRSTGTEIPFVGDKTDALPLGPAQSTLTLWVEWASPAQGTAELSVEPVAAAVPKDRLVFHTFHSIVVALGGENQVPTDPADPAEGTFVVAVDLYQQGYDVHMYDEDNVSADGTGAVFDEVATAVEDRAVSNVAIFGYSHGGGSTYSLADLLDLNRAGLGVFEIQFTSYVDAVRNNSDIDVAQELRRPPSTVYHLNQYQHGSLLQDFGLDGGPVPDSRPPPTGLDVETTAWGADATHFEIDDFVQVRDLIETSLGATVAQEANVNAMELMSPTVGGDRSRLRGRRFSDLWIPLVLLTIPSAGVGDALGAGVSDLQPDAGFQAAITNVVAAQSEPEQAEALDQLAALDDGTHQQLVRQLVYYSSHARGTQGGMAAGVILQRLRVPDSAIVAALVPLLETADPDVQKSVRSILGGFEGRAPGRRPDFSVYRGIIADRLRAGEGVPEGLIRYMYADEPGVALLTMMRAAQFREPGEIKAILWAEHVVSDVLWKQRNGFLKSDEVEPAAAEQLVELAGRSEWWVRLYVAEVMAQHAAFRQPAVMESLARDAYPLVREVVTAAQSGGEVR